MVALNSEVLNDNDCDRVNRAVREAESATTAEIVPVIARSSGRYDRPEDMIGLWVAGLAIVAVWWVFPLPRIETGSWGTPSAIWQLVALLAGATAGFLAGALIGGRVDWLRRLFTPSAQMRDEVDGRARQVFFDRRVHHTTGGCGVLLYISLFERMTAVVADQAVLELLGQEAIDEVCLQLSQRLRQGDLTAALCDTIALLGQRLAPLLPRAEGDVNELADALVVID
jgi:putative membrane protein